MFRNLEWIFPEIKMLLKLMIRFSNEPINIICYQLKMIYMCNKRQNFKSYCNAKFKKRKHTGGT